MRNLEETQIRDKTISALGWQEGTYLLEFPTGKSKHGDHFRCDALSPVFRCGLEVKSANYPRYTLRATDQAELYAKQLYQERGIGDLWSWITVTDRETRIALFVDGQRRTFWVNKDIATIAAHQTPFQWNPERWEWMSKGLNHSWHTGPVRKCTKCKIWLPPDRFSLIKKTGRLTTQCKGCRSAHERARLKDPEYRAKRNKQKREAGKALRANPAKREEINRKARERNKERYHSDPEYREHQRALNRKSWAKKAKDPAFREKRRLKEQARRDRQKETNNA